MKKKRNLLRFPINFSELKKRLNLIDWTSEANKAEKNKNIIKNVDDAKKTELEMIEIGVLDILNISARRVIIFCYIRSF
jgi:hypothetical protein